MDITEFANEDAYAAQAATGALLNPRIDSTFKALFTQTTPESQATAPDQKQSVPIADAGREP